MSEDGTRKEILSAQMKTATKFSPNFSIPIMYGNVGQIMELMNPLNSYGCNWKRVTIFWGQPIYSGTGGPHSQPDLGEYE